MSFTVNMVRLHITKEAIGKCLSARVCVCVCCSALCERWCENASRGACVSSASNMMEICGTYLQCDTSQNDVSQPCYIRATLAQPAGPFLKHRPYRGKKKGKNRACLKLCVVTLISPKTKEVCPYASAHAIQEVLNPQGGSCHVHWIRLPPLKKYILFHVVFLKLWEKIGLHWLALCEQSIFTNLLDPLRALLASRESSPQDGSSYRNQDNIYGIYKERKARCEMLWKRRRGERNQYWRRERFGFQLTGLCGFAQSVFKSVRTFLKER